MSISVNGQSQVPPGFRFHPTEEELLQYYLRKKVAFEKIDLDVIQDVDLNKLEPWDIQEKCKIGSTSTPQNDWYFFSHKDKKYPTGTRTNRATVAGFWKATGRDKVIYSNSKRIGMRKTLVFYKGRAPHGQKSDWIMHEYRLDDNSSSTTTTTLNNNYYEANHNNNVCSVMGELATQEEGWVVCRVFKKKNHIHIKGSSNTATTTTTITSSNSAAAAINCDHGGTLEQMLQYMGNYPLPSRRSNIINDHQYLEGINDDEENKRFLKLPSLQESPNNSSSTCRHIQINYQPIIHHMESSMLIGGGTADHHHQENANNINTCALGTNYDDESSSSRIQDWASLDRLVASHLNCQTTTTTTNDQTSKQHYNDHSIISSRQTILINDNHDDVLQTEQEIIVKLPSAYSSSMVATPPPNYGTANDQDYHENNECDLWNFAAGSSNDHQLGHSHTQC